MKKEGVDDRLMDKEDEKHRVILQNIGNKLLGSGLKVNWSANKDAGLALIVGDKCIIRIQEDGRAAGKFWGTNEDAQLKQKIQEVLGDEVFFADYTFDIGGPQIGEEFS